MKNEKDYAHDISEIRSMMERASKFLSLSGWAGVMAGIYALIGTYFAHRLLHGSVPMSADTGLQGSAPLVFLAGGVLTLAVGTAVLLSYQKARKRRERLWSVVSRKLVIDMAVPLVSGGLLILFLMVKGLTALAAPLTLIFYGIALFQAGKSSFGALRTLGLVDIGLGLLGVLMPAYGLMCWAVGFGVLHIVYGIYIHYRYEQ